jgi:hypothetical protein
VVDILVNNLVLEAGVLDSGSQIIVIREDLAREAQVSINPQRRLEMEAASGGVSWTLGCAEDLHMRIGDIPFKVHAHIVQRAPFHLLLGRPFHHLLRCRLEDHPDGLVEVSLRNPSDPLHVISVPSRPRKSHQAGYLGTFSLSTQTSPPHLNAFDTYQVAALVSLTQASHDLPTSILAYKKVAKKV